MRGSPPAPGSRHGGQGPGCGAAPGGLRDGDGDGSYPAPRARTGPGRGLPAEPSRAGPGQEQGSGTGCSLPAGLPRRNSDFSLSPFFLNNYYFLNASRF